MKAVKFIMCCVISALICLIPFRVDDFSNASYAATARYARADARDIYFCERKDLNSALFTVPYTYCVEILSEDGGWYYVKYAEDNSSYRALFGYCLTDKLTPIDVPPENIYLNMPITVTYKTDAPIGSLPVLNELNVTAVFYGTYYSGATAYSYVYYDGAFGYVYGANDTYPLNEIPTAEEVTEPTESADYTVVIALAVCGVAAAALLVLYLSGRKKYFRPDK